MAWSLSSAGLVAPATFADAADANTLDDYEEGVYTATLTCVSGSITFKTAVDTFAYTKIGRQVTITGRIQVDSVSSPSGATTFNLPFTNTSDLADQSEQALLNVLTHGVNLPAGTIDVAAEIPGAAATTALLIYSLDNAAWAALDGSTIVATDYFYLTGSYFTD